MHVIGNIINGSEKWKTLSIRITNEQVHRTKSAVHLIYFCIAPVTPNVIVHAYCAIASLNNCDFSTFQCAQKSLSDFSFFPAGRSRRSERIPAFHLRPVIHSESYREVGFYYAPMEVGEILCVTRSPRKVSTSEKWPKEAHFCEG